MPLAEPLSEPLADSDEGSTPEDSIADEFEVVDHYQSAVNRLIQEYKKSPSEALTNFAAFLKATTSNADELETTLQAVLVSRALGNAMSAQLDALGKIVGVQRDGRTDEDYTALIRSQIKVNLSSGTTEDLFAVVAPLLGVGDSVQIQESQPAAFVLTLHAVTSANRAALIARLVKQARAAGVYGQVVFSEVPPSQTFTLDTGPGLDVGHLAGSIPS